MPAYSIPITSIATTTPKWTNTGSVGGDIAKAGSNLWGWMADSYAYRGIATPPTYQGPAAPATLAQMQGDWTPDEAISQGWSELQAQLKEFYNQQAIRNEATTPWITPDSLSGSISNITDNLMPSWQTLALIAGLGIVGMMIVGKVLNGR